MSELKIEISHGDVKCKIERDKYDMNMLSTRNGYQWSGMPVDDEMIDMLHDLIIEYKSQKEPK